ncbi:MAG: hypothetical protein DRJ03_30645 [Chloroflexi bacterium]|nr:MAG: hypothetical protein DRJ03_30645 [Chloroflexota bacterium]
MPKLSKDKARRIATEYCRSGCKKAETLLNLGYTKSFANSSSGRLLFDKPVIRTEIEKIMRRNENKVDVEISEIIQGLREIAFPDEGVQVNNSDRNRALELLGKYKCIWTDRIDIQDYSDQAIELSESQRLAAKEIARLALQVNPPSFTDSDILSGTGD